MNSMRFLGVSLRTLVMTFALSVTSFYLAGCKSCEESCGDMAIAACGEGNVASFGCTQSRQAVTAWNPLSQSVELRYITIYTCQFNCQEGGNGGLDPGDIMGIDDEDFRASGVSLENMRITTAVGDCQTDWKFNAEAAEELGREYGGNWLAFSPPPGIETPPGMPVTTTVKVTHGIPMGDANSKMPFWQDMTIVRRQGADAPFEVDFVQPIYDYPPMMVVVGDKQVGNGPVEVSVENGLLLAEVRFKAAHTSLPVMSYRVVVSKDGDVIHDEAIGAPGRLNAWKGNSIQDVDVPTDDLAVGESYNVRFVGSVGDIEIASTSFMIEMID